MGISKKDIRRGLKIIFGKRPIYKTANVVQLAPNELLKDRIALITGGTSGIGFAIAKAFLNAGAAVVITGRNEQRLQLAMISLSCNGKFEGKVFGECLDNRDVSQQSSVFENVLKKLGGVK